MTSLQRAIKTAATDSWVNDRVNTVLIITDFQLDETIYIEILKEIKRQRDLVQN